MDIFPFIQPAAQEEESLPLCRETKWNFTKDKPVFKNGEPVIVTGNEAVKVWIWNALKTERKRYVIYTHNYGSDIEELIGQPYSEAVKSIEAGRYIEDCLLINPYITAVKDIEAVFEKDCLKISFSAETIYGSIEMRGDSFV